MATCETCKANKVCDHNKYGFENCNNYIFADVEKVVRCKDCAYSNADGTICHYGVGSDVKPEHFCSDGERRDT